MVYRLLHRLLQRAKRFLESDDPIPHPTEIAPLTNESYEALLVQITEGMAQGWQQPQLFAVLGVQRHDPWFVSWLRRYSKILLRQSPEPMNRAFAQRLIRLEVIGCGELGMVAAELGRQLLALNRGDRPAEPTLAADPALVTTFESENPVELLGYGMELYQRRELEGAIAIWSRAIEHNPQHSEAHLASGVALFQLGRYEQAIATFDVLLDQDDPPALVWFNRGSVYLRQKKFSAAIADFEAALALDKELYPAYVARGVAYQHQQQWNAAFQDFSHAIALQIPDYRAYNGRGQIHSIRHNFEAAIADFSTALNFDPNAAEVYQNRGQVYAHLHQWDASLRDLTQAIRTAPNLVPAYGCRGRVYLELGEYQRAALDYREVLTRQPEQISAWNGLGLALARNGQAEEAIAQFNEMLQQQPDCWVAWANRGWAMYFARDTAGPNVAIANWQAALLEFQTQADVYPQALSVLYHNLACVWAKLAASQPNERAALETAVQYNQKALNTQPHQVGSDVEQLQLLEHLIIVYERLSNPRQSKHHLHTALLLLQQVLLACETDTTKFRVASRFKGLYQLKVDQLTQSEQARHHLQALELFEERQTQSIQAQLKPQLAGQALPTLAYAQMQRLLSEHMAAVYWHVSPAAIAIFLLLKGRPPIVITSNYEQRQALQETWKHWQVTYDADRTTPDDAESPWRSQIPEALDDLFIQLGMEHILSRLPEAVTHVLLIPDQLLLPLPVATLFKKPYCDRDFSVSQLPALQWAASLVLSPELPSAGISEHPALLAIDGPSAQIFPTERLLPATASTQASPPKTPPTASLETAAIAAAFPTLHLSYASTPPARLLGQLQMPFNIFHFAGPATFNVSQPLQSQFHLTHSTSLTVADLLKPTYSSPPLVCLTQTTFQHLAILPQTEACLSLPAAFLSKGASYVLIALWSGPEVSTTLLMWQFYQQLTQAIAPAQALTAAQQWLQSATVETLLEVAGNWRNTLWAEAEEIPAALEQAVQTWQTLSDEVRDSTANNTVSTTTELESVTDTDFEGERPNVCPYEHPYYWSGFTIMGKVD